MSRIKNRFKHILSFFLIMFIVLLSGCQKVDYGNKLTSSISVTVNEASQNFLGDYNGVIAVCNYQTGELLCCVSKVEGEITSNIEIFDNPQNTFLYSLYTPGSIMKIVTALCAVENLENPYSFSHNCTGSCNIDDGIVSCLSAHGEMMLPDALRESCNCYFANLAIHLGVDRITKTAKSLGFNVSQNYFGVSLKESYFEPVSTKNIDLGWACVGQSSTLINPAHYLGIVSAIANNGRSVMRDIKGKEHSFISINEEYASLMKDYLRANVESKYGDDRFENLEMCGKTGTAQIAGKISTSLFAGFSQRDDLPLAIICIVEEAGAGQSKAIEISNKVMQHFLSEVMKNE